MSRPPKTAKAPEKAFIIGDVHGCFEEFLSLLKKAGRQARGRRLIFVGDLINRGPRSLDMLKWLKKNGAEAVRGNHEDGFLRAVRKNLPLSPALEQLKKDMGGGLEGWLQWISSWPFYIEGEGFLAVHAGLVPGEHPRLSRPGFLMNIRTWDGRGKDLKSAKNPPWHDFYKGEKPVIYGHWACQGLKIKKNSIGLDSGCVYGKQLSGVLLPERRIVQVPARKAYCPF